jgi:hypothetical protein
MRLRDEVAKPMGQQHQHESRARRQCITAGFAYGIRLNKYGACI